MNENGFAAAAAGAGAVPPNEKPEFPVAGAGAGAPNEKDGAGFELLFDVAEEFPAVSALDASSSSPSSSSISLNDAACARYCFIQLE